MVVLVADILDTVTNTNTNLESTWVSENMQMLEEVTIRALETMDPAGLLIELVVEEEVTKEVDIRGMMEETMVVTANKRYFFNKRTVRKHKSTGAQFTMDISPMGRHPGRPALVAK